MTDKDKTDQVEPQANQQVQDEALEGVTGAGMKMTRFLKNTADGGPEAGPDNEHLRLPLFEAQVR